MDERKCYVCEGTKPKNMFSYRCKKHDVCISCGVNRKYLEETPWGIMGGFICQDCEKKRISEKIKKFQKDNESESLGDDVIICPYCGEIHREDGERPAFYEDGKHNFTCSDCMNEFEVDTYISYSYTTKKLTRKEK